MRKILVLLRVSNYAESNFTYTLAFPANFKSTIYLEDLYPVNSTKDIFTSINKFLKEENIKQFKKLVIKITFKKRLLLFFTFINSQK
tara:strand:+ start:199 stop:459 length:261 start_codon:yes stop_codon:yes gene_type:complete